MGKWRKSWSRRRVIGVEKTTAGERQKPVDGVKRLCRQYVSSQKALKLLWPQEGVIILELTSTYLEL